MSASRRLMLMCLINFIIFNIVISVWVEILKNLITILLSGNILCTINSALGLSMSMAKV